MENNLDLFPEDKPAQGNSKRVPLPEALRPQTFQDFAGLDRLDSAIVSDITVRKGLIPSLILWGPPGCGKTTFAELIGRHIAARFVKLSAVESGVKDVKLEVEKAKNLSTPTVLFVDEIHRFNRAQQDVFLPYLEKGDITLVGATTENPSFYLTGALLSRMRVLVFPALDDQAMRQIMIRAKQRTGLNFEPKAEDALIDFVAADARQLLILVEALGEKVKTGEKALITSEYLRDFLGDRRTLLYDRSGDNHYTIISAFIKSMRGSNPDAALFWAFKMIESGEDPRFIIRRMIIFASEDIGNADPQALPLATATLAAFEAVGLPEGKIPISHCITYLACAPKSNRSYLAMHKAIAAVNENPNAAVPLHLRNPETPLQKSLNYGKGYKYPHDFGGYVGGVNYLPQELSSQVFYEPSEIGREREIIEHLSKLRAERNLKGPKA